MSLNLMRIMVNFVQYFDGQLVGYQPSADILENQSGSQRILGPLMSQFLGLSQAGNDHVEDLTWNAQGVLRSPRAFKAEDFREKIRRVNKFIDDLEQSIVTYERNGLRSICDREFGVIRQLLNSLSLNFLDERFLRELDINQVRKREVDRLRSWFDLVVRLKNSVQVFTHLFDFLMLSGDTPCSASANKILREAYVDSFLSVAKKSLPEYYELSRELIQPSVGSAEWQASVVKFLSETEKKKLHGFYHQIMGEPYGHKFMEACLNITDAGVRAAFLEVNHKIKFSSSSESLKFLSDAELSENKAKIFATYNHFAMLFAAYCPMRLVEFDQRFQKQFSSHFPSDHLVNKSSHGFFSASLRKEYVKFLLLQQIVVTAGVAFKEGNAFQDRQNLDLAVHYLSEHRSWFGKVANKFFGYKTETHRVYEAYQKTLHSDIGEQDKKILMNEVRDFVRVKVGSLRKRLGVGAESISLLEDQFPQHIKVHPKGVSVARRAARPLVSELCCV